MRTLNLLLALLAPAALAAPQEARVTSVVFAGSGCPAAKDIEGKLSADLATLSVPLPALEAKAGDGVPLRAARVNCDVLVTIEHSPGFQLAPVATTVKTSGKVAAGAEGLVSYRTHFQGQQATQSAEHKVASPGEATLKLTADYSPCGKTTTLVQNYSVRLAGRGKTESTLKMDDAGSTELAWRACK